MTDEIASFFHSRNIQSGYGRILYVRSTVTCDGSYLPDGYALPGGRRTASEAEAREAAEFIDRLTRSSTVRTPEQMFNREGLTI